MTGADQIRHRPIENRGALLKGHQLTEMYREELYKPIPIGEVLPVDHCLLMGGSLIRNLIPNVKIRDLIIPLEISSR